MSYTAGELHTRVFSLAKSLNSEQIVRLLIARLREERLKQGLSQNALAIRAGLSHTMVLRLERSDRMPTLDTLLRLAEALGVDLSDYLRDAIAATTASRQVR